MFPYLLCPVATHATEVLFRSGAQALESSAQASDQPLNLPQ